MKGRIIKCKIRQRNENLGVGEKENTNEGQKPERYTEIFGQMSVRWERRR